MVRQLNIRVLNSVVYIEGEVKTVSGSDNNVTSKLNFDIVVEGDGSSWQFIQSELEYLQKKHANFFENWEYPNG